MVVDLCTVHALIEAKFNLNSRVRHGATRSSLWAKPGLLAFNHIGLYAQPSLPGSDEVTKDFATNLS